MTVAIHWALEGDLNLLFYRGCSVFVVCASIFSHHLFLLNFRLKLEAQITKYYTQQPLQNRIFRSPSTAQCHSHGIMLTELVQVSNLRDHLLISVLSCWTSNPSLECLLTPELIILCNNTVFMGFSCLPELPIICLFMEYTSCSYGRSYRL